MGIIRPLLLFTIIIINVNKAALQDNDTRKVVFVNVLHRHGARTPVYFYPTDPYQHDVDTFWPEGLGQLTNLGKRQTFELGQWLRRRYDALLTDLYSPNIIYVQSTDIDRTLMSAECVMAGMYPPAGVQEWSDDLSWQPIPVHTTSVNTDKVLSRPPYTPCPAFDQEIQRIFTSDEQIRGFNQTYSELFRWTNENAGTNFSLKSIYLIYDTLFVESSYNLTLPEWTKKVYPEPMRAANVICYMLETWTTKNIRLRIGLLLQDMIKNMVDKVHSNTTRYVHVYSAHDGNIINLMGALGVFNNMLPPYAACLVMELHRDSGGDYYVSLLYRNSSVDEPYLLAVKGCSPQCPLDKFINITQPLIPVDWDLECGLRSEADKQPSLPKLTIVLVFVAAAVV